jgi:hypothetical protein
MKVRPFDPERLLETLARHRVRFVIIGGFAARLLGSPTLTNDLDICYARDPKNLAALAAALIELEAILRRAPDGATLRGAPEGLPFRPDPPTLAAGDHFTLSTSAGNLDCIGTPAGSSGFPDLIAGAAEMKIGRTRVFVVSLEDLIQMKKASGRPKDRVELEILGALKEEIERGRT